jgi:hypothetical protein
MQAQTRKAAVELFPISKTFSSYAALFQGLLGG